MPPTTTIASGFLRLRTDFCRNRGWQHAKDGGEWNHGEEAALAARLLCESLLLRGGPAARNPLKPGDENQPVHHPDAKDRDEADARRDIEVEPHEHQRPNAADDNHNHVAADHHHVEQRLQRQIEQK